MLHYKYSLIEIKSGPSFHNYIVFRYRGHYRQKIIVVVLKLNFI